MNGIGTGEIGKERRRVERGRRIREKRSESCLLLYGSNFQFLPLSAVWSRAQSVSGPPFLSAVSTSISCHHHLLSPTLFFLSLSSIHSRHFSSITYSVKKYDCSCPTFSFLGPTHNLLIYYYTLTCLVIICVIFTFVF